MIQLFKQILADPFGSATFNMDGLVIAANKAKKAAQSNAAKEASKAKNKDAAVDTIKFVSDEMKRSKKDKKGKRK